MVQKINPHPAPRCNRSPTYYVFSKDATLGSVPSISSEVLGYSKNRKGAAAEKKVKQRPSKFLP
jgi:hypothetical protein